MDIKKLKLFKYQDLSPRQKEAYNYHKLAAILADYGYTCVKLFDDWNGADFIAVSVSNDSVLRIQLKARFAFQKKYLGKGLFIAFPIDGKWYICDHDYLVEEYESKKPSKFQIASWTEKGSIHTDNPNHLELSICKQLNILP